MVAADRSCQALGEYSRAGWLLAVKDLFRDSIHSTPEADDDARRADVKVYTSFELMGELVALAIIAALWAFVAIGDRYQEWQARMRERERAGQEERSAERDGAVGQRKGPEWVRDWRERENNRP
jgi:hypothetical protein